MHPLRIAGIVCGTILLSPLIVIALALVIAACAICLPFLILFSPCIGGALCLGFSINDKNNNKTLSLPIELDNLKNEYAGKVDPIKMTHLSNSIMALNDNKEEVSLKQLKQIKHDLKAVKKDLKQNLTKHQYKHLLLQGNELKKMLKADLQAEVTPTLRMG